MALQSLLIFGICSLFQIAGLALMALPSGGHFIPSAYKKRNGDPSQLLVDDDEHVYTLKRENKKTKVWRCVRHTDRRCKVEVFTNKDVSFL